LYAADEVQRWFAALELSPAERRDILGRTHWLLRTFGDIRVETLMVPTDPPDGRVLDRMLNRRTRTEAGFVAGFTSVAGAPALIFGRRYFWNVPSLQAPDIAAEAVAMFPAGRRPIGEVSLWSTYGLDAVTSVIAGVGWFSHGPSVDVAVGTDIRIGQIRVRPTWRLRDGGFNARVTTTF
jgi:hypothetical protein